jgi:hypothetical protein
MAQQARPKVIGQNHSLGLIVAPVHLFDLGFVLSKAIEGTEEVTIALLRNLRGATVAT